MDCDALADQRVARLIDANLDRAREGLRVVEDWCRFGLERQDLVIRLKDWRQKLGLLHRSEYKQARSSATDQAAGLSHPAQLKRRDPEQVVAANCARVQEALRVLEEYSRSDHPQLAAQAATIRYGLYDLEVEALIESERTGRSELLRNCRLCLITQPCTDLIQRVGAALQAGVPMVQYRCKEAEDQQRFAEATELRELCRTHHALFIVNDRIDLALAVDADGVHLGQDDFSTQVARRLMGNRRLVGRSTHNLEEVVRAQNEGCDSLGLGPVHATAVKAERTAIGPELVHKACEISTIPLFAIGGINTNNLPTLTAGGCKRVAVIGAIMAASHPESASIELLQQL